MIPTTLPVDSAERKEIPVVTGCLLYFPAAILSVAGRVDCGVIEALSRTLGFSTGYKQGSFATPHGALSASADLCAAALSLSQSLHERLANAPVPYSGDDAWSLYPAALAGVARHSVAGNQKHNPGEPLHHARGKSTDHADCIGRHLMDVNDLLAYYERNGTQEHLAGMEEQILTEASALCWRALALAQQLHEDYGAPLAPAARLPERVVPIVDRLVKVECCDKYVSETISCKRDTKHAGLCSAYGDA